MNKNIIEKIKSTKNKNGVKSYFCLPDFSAYNSISEVKDNRLFFTAMGGGFVRSIDLDNPKFVRDVKESKVIFTDQPPKPVYKKVKLSMDSIGEIIGYSLQERKWNGWSIVQVELDQVKKLNELYVKSGLGDHTTVFKVVDDDTLTIEEEIDFNEETQSTVFESKIIKSELIEVEGKKVKTFDLMSYNWCWSEEEL
jgi:hypothetical protein|tara:strand:- start:1895 stop:2482 length:588 start_codon:yes stop_codon:yes gene_type:complete